MAFFWKNLIMNKIKILTLAYQDLRFGGNNRARTYDPLLVRQMLSQLSYAPIRLLHFLQR